MHRPRSAKHHTRPSVTVPSLPCADLWPAGGAWHQHQAELTFRLPHCVCCSQRPANGTRRGVGEAFERSAATASSKARVGVPPSLACRLCPSGQQHQQRHQRRTAGSTRAHASVQAPHEPPRQVSSPWRRIRVMAPSQCSLPCGPGIDRVKTAVVAIDVYGMCTLCCGNSSARWSSQPCCRSCNVQAHGRCQQSLLFTTTPQLDHANVTVVRRHVCQSVCWC